MDPVTALVLGGAATLFNVAGGIMQGQAQAAQAGYQAQVAANNQKIANQYAEYATQAGQEEARKQGLTDRARMGAIRAAEGASGIDPNSGSALDVRQSERETGVGDVSTIEHNAALRAYGYETQAVNYGAQSQLYSAQARQATAMIPFTAATGLLGGAASLGEKWVNFQNQGVL